MPLRLADISGTNGTVGLNGGNFLIPATTVVGSTAVDQIYGTANTLDDWYLVTAADVLHNVSPGEIKLI